MHESQRKMGRSKINKDLNLSSVSIIFLVFQFGDVLFGAEWLI